MLARGVCGAGAGDADGDAFDLWIVGDANGVGCAGATGPGASLACAEY